MSEKRFGLVPHVGVGAVCSPLEVGADRAAQAAEQLAALLRQLGCEVVQGGVLDSPDKAAAAGRRFAEAHVHAVACAAASWFEDYLVTDLLEECRCPVLLWSLRGMETGALCGVQQLTVVLVQLGWPFYAVYGPLEAQVQQQEAAMFLQAATLRHWARLSGPDLRLLLPPE